MVPLGPGQERGLRAASPASGLGVGVPGPAEFLRGAAGSWWEGGDRGLSWAGGADGRVSVEALAEAQRPFGLPGIPELEGPSSQS